MSKKHFYHRMVLIALLIVFVTGASGTIFSETNAITDTQDSIDQLSVEEENVLLALYAMEQKISYLEEESLTLGVEISNSQDDIKKLDQEILLEQDKFTQLKEALGLLLQSYQRRGPGTFIELLLNAESLDDFLSRLNLLRDLTKGTNQLLETLTLTQANLEQVKTQQLDKIATLLDQQTQLQNLLAEQKVAKDQQEVYLLSLQDERTKYEDILEDINTSWEELQPIFSETSKEFSKLAESGRLPQDALVLSLSLAGIEAVLSESSFNQAIINNSTMPNMTFSFHDGNITVEVPDYQLVLQGNFIVEEEKTLLFVAEAGSFYNLPLEPTMLDALFSKGDLVLELSSLLDNNRIKKVASEEEQLVLMIKFSLF